MGGGSSTSVSRKHSSDDKNNAAVTRRVIQDMINKRRRGDCSSGPSQHDKPPHSAQSRYHMVPRVAYRLSAVMRKQPRELAPGGWKQHARPHSSRRPEGRGVGMHPPRNGISSRRSCSSSGGGNISLLRWKCLFGTPLLLWTARQ